MAFRKGQSGNPLGRPRRNRVNASTVKAAWDVLVKLRPELLQDAFERGLEGKKSLGFLELGAKLGGEIGNQGDGRQQIAIIFNSPLDTAKLRPGTQTIHLVEGSLSRVQELEPGTETPILEETLQTEEDEVLEVLDGN